MAFLIYEVGCIECGVPSGPFGIFETAEEAKRQAATLSDTWQRYGGDGFLQLIDLETLECKRISYGNG